MHEKKWLKNIVSIKGSNVNKGRVELEVRVRIETDLREG